MALTLSRVVIGQDEDGDEISTLVVDNIEPAPLGAAKGASAKKVPPSLRLLIEVVAQAEDEAGETLQPWPDGPLVRAVNDDEVRRRYYARIAEQAGRDDDRRNWPPGSGKPSGGASNLHSTQKLLVAMLQSGIRFLRLPDASVTPATPLKGRVA